jgi:acyl-CoA thioesterase FadM
MTIFTLHSEPLKDEWLDAYGHLNEAYYLVPFTAANWAIMDRFGIGLRIRPDGSIQEAVVVG